ncbi:MAG: hypothetical protein ACKVQC_07110 [Elusimicrobiota bacterium]
MFSFRSRQAQLSGNGKKLSFPIPFFSVQSQKLNGTRIIAWIPNEEKYFQKILGTDGWKLRDQLGSMYHFSKDTTTIQIFRKQIISRWLIALDISEVVGNGDSTKLLSD